MAWAASPSVDGRGKTRDGHPGKMVAVSWRQRGSGIRLWRGPDSPLVGLGVATKSQEDACDLAHLHWAGELGG